MWSGKIKGKTSPGGTKLGAWEQSQLPGKTKQGRMQPHIQSKNQESPGEG